MKVVLELQDQPSNIKKVTVRHDIVIGRGADCNLRLSAPQVSRRHSFLRVGSDGVSVADLDSSNGTYLNGKRLSSGKRYALEDGTILAVGPVKFVARVNSGVPIGEALEVRMQDDLGDVQDAIVTNESATDINSDATITSGPIGSGSGILNFAVEQAGLSVGEDEPTTDYVPSDAKDVGKFDDVEEVEPLPGFENVSVLEAGELIDEKPLDVVEVLEFVDDGDEVLDAVAVVEDADVVEVEADEILVIEDDEVLVVDDDDIVEVSEGGDSEESDLRNFLSGLD